jgi:hypothetical protein
VIYVCHWPSQYCRHRHSYVMTHDNIATLHHDPRGYVCIMPRHHTISDATLAASASTHDQRASTAPVLKGPFPHQPQLGTRTTTSHDALTRSHYEPAVPPKVPRQQHTCAQGSSSPTSLSCLHTSCSSSSSFSAAKARLRPSGAHAAAQLASERSRSCGQYLNNSLWN